MRFFMASREGVTYKRCFSPQLRVYFPDFDAPVMAVAVPLVFFLPRPSALFFHCRRQFSTLSVPSASSTLLPKAVLILAEVCLPCISRVRSTGTPCQRSVRYFGYIPSKPDWSFPPPSMNKVPGVGRTLALVASLQGLPFWTVCAMRAIYSRICVGLEKMMSTLRLILMRCPTSLRPVCPYLGRILLLQ